MINKLKPLKKKGYQNTGAVSSQDSVRHQFGKTLKYEATRGAADGSGLSNFGNPNLPPGATEKQANDWMMQNIYPKLGSFPTAMEKGEAGDFMYNSGKDLRPYAIQEYLRQQDPQNKRGWQDTDGKYKDRKDPSKWDSYWSEVQKLPLNQKRVLGNKGRDWYYKNINNKPDGSPDDAYKNTWYGRIWNTNDYNEFDPNNPKFTPKFQDAGNAAQLGKLDPNAQALNDQYYTTPAAGIRKYNTGLNQRVSGLVGTMGDQIQKAMKVAAAVATGGASTMATGMTSKAAMGIPSAPNAPAPTMQGTTAPLNPNGDQAFGTRGIVPKPQPSHGKDAWQQSQLPGEQYNPPRTPTTPVAPIGTLGTMGKTVKSQPETLDGYDELQKWKNENGGFNSTDISKQDVPRASIEGPTTVHSNKEGTAKMDWSKGMKQGAVGMAVAGIQYGLAKAADNMEPALDPNLMRPGQNNMWKNVQAAQTGGTIRQRKYSFQQAGEVKRINEKPVLYEQDRPVRESTYTPYEPGFIQEYPNLKGRGYQYNKNAPKWRTLPPAPKMGRPYNGPQMVNNTGYTPGYQSFNNPYNIIPSNNITMQNTPFPIRATADTGEKRVLYPGQNYKFAGAKRVLEVPMA